MQCICGELTHLLSTEAIVTRRLHAIIKPAITEIMQGDTLFHSLTLNFLSRTVTFHTCCCLLYLRDPSKSPVGQKPTDIRLFHCKIPEKLCYYYTEGYIL